MALTYTPVSNGDKITLCNGFLANRMQCTRAGEFTVTDTENKDMTPYQVCNRHKAIMEAGLSMAPIPEVPGTGTVQAQVSFEQAPKPEPPAKDATPTITEKK